LLRNAIDCVFNPNRTSSPWQRQNKTCNPAGNPEAPAARAAGKTTRLDKLEAQAQALQETQGTYATKIILQSGLSGLCGLVAQLGRVEPRYQLAMETAAGGAWGSCSENDAVAAAGIELLKQNGLDERRSYPQQNSATAILPNNCSTAQMDLLTMRLT